MAPTSPRGVAASAFACGAEEDGEVDLPSPPWAAPHPSAWRCAPGAAAVTPAGGVDVGGGGDRPFTLGVASMQRKLNHPLMESFLSSLTAALPAAQVVRLHVETLADRPVGSWPVCDVLLAFHAPGFPLAAVNAYATLHGMPLINSLAAQFTLRDRARISDMLSTAAVPTPSMVVRLDGTDAATSASGSDRTGGCGARVASDTAAGRLPGRMGAVTQDCDWLLVDGARALRMPFVEKPLNSDEHKCIVYYLGDGGTSTIERKKVHHEAGRRAIRPSGSYVYEQFHSAEDVKVYAIGTEVFFAETRVREADGSVRRAPTVLSPDEQRMAGRVAAAFGQFLTGFDIIRCADGRSLVIDVNGWSIGKAESGAFIKAAVPALARHLRGLVGSGLARGARLGPARGARLGPAPDLPALAWSVHGSQRGRDSDGTGDGDGCGADGVGLFGTQRGVDAGAARSAKADSPASGDVANRGRGADRRSGAAADSWQALTSALVLG